MPNPFRRLLPVRKERGVERLLWLTPQLAQGGCPSVEEVPALLRLGVDWVLDLREEAGAQQEALRRAGIRHCHLPMAEYEPPAVAQLEEGARLALAELSKGRRILVYCRLGKSRSVCMTCAILVALGEPLVTALDRFRVAGRAALSPRQLDCLGEFEALRARPASAGTPE